MRGRISLLRAYTRRLKPGDPVEFNPQPDPPGGEVQGDRGELMMKRFREEAGDVLACPD